MNDARPKPPIVFLDIDGVICTMRSLLCPKALLPAPRFDPVALGIVARLCTRVAGARVVFNTTHNRRPVALMEHTRALETYLHPACPMTRYPDCPDRLLAIAAWCARYGEGEHTNWVALDDTPIAHERAILVDPATGLTYRDYCAATEKLGHPDTPAFLL